VIFLLSVDYAPVNKTAENQSKWRSMNSNGMP